MASNRDKLKAKRAELNLQRLEISDKTSQADNFVDSEIKKFENIDNHEQTNENNIIYRTKNYDQFHDFPDEKLKLPLLKGEKRELLKSSIKQIGVQTPAKVIRVSDFTLPLHNDYKPEDFIILGGHNRLDICKELDLEYPYIILHDLNQATINKIVAEDHLLNRQLNDMSPSEKVHLFKALNEDTRTFSEKFKEQKESRAVIYRLLQLQKLCDEFVSWVDGKDGHKLPIYAATSISSLDEGEQNNLILYLSENRIKAVTIKQADALKDLKQSVKLEGEKLSKKDFDNVFKTDRKESLKSSKSKSNFSKDILKLIPIQERDKAEDIIKQALKMYYETNS